jgi:hypothetical protein
LQETLCDEAELDLTVISVDLASDSVAVSLPLDSYLFIRKQEYFNKFKQLGAVG